MFYDISKQFDIDRLKAKLNALAVKAKTQGTSIVIEVTEKRQRTLNQNNYLYLLFGIFAMETGNTSDYVKEVIFKRHCNADLFVLVVEDKMIGKAEILRSTRDLSKEQMSLAIDRFKDFASQNGIYLPSPEDTDLLKEAEYELSRMKQYIY